MRNEDAPFSQIFWNFLPHTYSCQQKLLHEVARQFSQESRGPPWLAKVNHILLLDPGKTVNDIWQFCSPFSLSKSSSIHDNRKQLLNPMETYTFKQGDRSPPASVMVCPPELPRQNCLSLWTSKEDHHKGLEYVSYTVKLSWVYPQRRGKTCQPWIPKECYTLLRPHKLTWLCLSHGWWTGYGYRHSNWSGGNKMHRL